MKMKKTKRMRTTRSVSNKDMCYKQIIRCWVENRLLRMNILVAVHRTQEMKMRCRRVE